MFLKITNFYFFVEFFDFATTSKLCALKDEDEMELIFLGLLFFLGFIFIPVLLFLGFVFLKIIVWGVVILSLLVFFGSGLGFLVVAGFTAYLFFYWLFGSGRKA